MQEDDYGFETVQFEKSTTESGNTGTAASADAKAVSDKVPQKENVSAPVKLEKKPVDDESDEEDLYSTSKATKKVNDKAAIQENMANLTIDKTFRPKDMYAMFLGTDFLYLDFVSDTW